MIKAALVWSKVTVPSTTEDQASAPDIVAEGPGGEMSKLECLAALIAVILYASAWSMAATAVPKAGDTADGERKPL